MSRVSPSDLAHGDERDAALLVRRVAQPVHQHVGRFAGGEEPFPP